MILMYRFLTYYSAYKCKYTGTEEFLVCFFIQMNKLKIGV